MIQFKGEKEMRESSVTICIKVRGAAKALHTGRRISAHGTCVYSEQWRALARGWGLYTRGRYHMRTQHVRWHARRQGHTRPSQQRGESGGEPRPLDAGEGERPMDEDPYGERPRRHRSTCTQGYVGILVGEKRPRSPTW